MFGLEIAVMGFYGVCVSLHMGVMDHSSELGLCVGDTMQMVFNRTALWSHLVQTYAGTSGTCALLRLS